MKKLALFVLIFTMVQQFVFAETVVYSDNGKFGLKDSDGNIVAAAKYKKLIRLGEQSWIMQSGSRFGIIHDDGKILVDAAYNQAERILGKYVKFRKGSKYGLFDELGFEVLPVEYSSIDLLYGGMFVVSKNYRYGLADRNGFLILDTMFDDIYMPDFNTLIVVYNNRQAEFVRNENGSGTIPFNITSYNVDAKSPDVKITDIASNPIVSTGYYGVTLTDYMLKLISSISPAYEQTIDELMFSQGADTVSVFVRFSWLPKFPFVYAKNYYSNIADPHSGPLNGAKKSLRRKIKN